MEFISQMTPYKNHKIDNDNIFDYFIKLVQKNQFDNRISILDRYMNPFVMQVISHPNFSPNDRLIEYYEIIDNAIIPHGINLPSEYINANSFKNYRTKQFIGHNNGMFIELNLYKQDCISNHHMSRRNGAKFIRLSDNDNYTCPSKGKHWLD